MVKADIAPVSSRERIEILDVLRGLAVCGILIGNLQWFSGYGMLPPSLENATPIYDQVTHFLVHFFIEGKFYSIFSFLFGVGFALQIARAEERGDTNASLFKRRLFWLLVIGLLHAYLLWAGDILSIYALMGFILILFRKKSNESLLKWAFALMAVPIFTYLLLYAAFLMFAPPQAPPNFDAEYQQWDQNVGLVQTSSYWQIVSGYNLDYIVGRYLGLIFNMRLPKILAMFLLGMYAYRIGVFQNLKAHGALIRKVLVYGSILGLIGNVSMAWLAGNEAPFPPSPMTVLGVIGYAFGVPALALFIMALVATLWQVDGWRKVLSVLAPVGRMALSNYLFQTVVCVTIFYGYGFGMFGSIGSLKATLIALAIFSVQILLSSIWLRYFAYGPMEWIWRQLTYGRRLPLTKAAQIS
ncbi:MAG: transporter [Acidobacteria bacterium]|nr:MAG: transporter [Acidobacteriota bacterium]